MFKFLGNYITVNFELYKVFYFVVKYKNITKTSEHLKVSQPAITKHIKNLENILGMKLIIKTSQGVALTEKGFELYKNVKQPIERLLEIEKKYKIVIK